MSDMNPAISIIIPAYQHGREIGACMRSIFRQTFTDFEVIAVNDGSTDNTSEALEQFGGRIKVINQENRGANAARNRGFKESRGEFVLFCDADIIMRRDMLEKMLRALRANPEASYAYCSFRFGWKTFHLWSFDADKLKKMNYIHTTSLIRRDRFPGFDESVRRLQDWDLWLTMLERGLIGVWIPEILFVALPHRGGISTWVPGVFYRIPWRKLGVQVRSVEKYLEAEKVVKEKHYL